MFCQIGFNLKLSISSINKCSKCFMHLQCSAIRYYDWMTWEQFLRENVCKTYSDPPVRKFFLKFVRRSSCFIP